MHIFLSLLFLACEYPVFNILVPAPNLLFDYLFVWFIVLSTLANCQRSILFAHYFSCFSKSKFQIFNYVRVMIYFFDFTLVACSVIGLNLK